MLAIWMYQWPWTVVAIPPLPIQGKGKFIPIYSASGEVLQPTGSGKIMPETTGSGKMLSWVVS